MKKKLIVSLITLTAIQAPVTATAASISDALNFFQGTPVNTNSGGAGTVSADFQSGLQQGIDEGRNICLADPASCGITVGTVLGDLQFGETEPNDHIISADPLTPLVPMTGQMYSASDEDWYYVETTEINSIIVLTMPESVGIWNVSLLDAGGNIFANSNSFSDTELQLETTVASPGFYYIVVRPTETYTSALYQLTSQIASPVNPDGQLVTTNFHDTETEPNNTLARADKLTSSVTTFGSLHLGERIDLYRIDSNGNETISIDLCWQNTSCAVPPGTTAGTGEPANTWVLYVFDGRIVTEESLTQQPLLNPGLSNTISSNDPYFLADRGAFGDALIATIDPSFGDETRVDLGVVEAGTYYIGISAPLVREDGSVVLEQDVKGVDTTGEEVTVTLPYLSRWYNDDQYTFKVNKTQLTPSIAGKRAE